MVTSKGKKWYYANGFQLSQCRKMCEFVFDAFYFMVEADKDNMIFNIYVFSSVNGDPIKDYINVEKFEKDFCDPKTGGQWRLKIIDPKN